MFLRFRISNMTTRHNAHRSQLTPIRVGCKKSQCLTYIRQTESYYHQKIGTFMKQF